MEHYFSPQQNSEQKFTEIEETIRGFRIRLKASTGTFASKKIDNGSRLLAERMIVGEEDSVLDLGCGNGLIGSIAARLTKGEVILTDVNPRACQTAKINTKGIPNTKILCGSMYEPVKGIKFDTILLNPPQTAGKKTCFEMIEQAKEHLNENGTLQIVARHNKGGETLSKKMKETFGNLETLAKKGGFRVYLSRKESR